MPSTLVGGMVSLEELEKAHILQVLEAVGWHKKRAAEILEINPSTLYRKLLRYGVGQDEDPEAGEPFAPVEGLAGESLPEDGDEADRISEAVEAAQGGEPEAADTADTADETAAEPEPASVQ